MFIFYSFIKNFSNATFPKYVSIRRYKQYYTIPICIAITLRERLHIYRLLWLNVYQMSYHTRTHIDDPQHTEYFCIMIVVLILLLSLLLLATRHQKAYEYRKSVIFFRTNKIVLCRIQRIENCISALCAGVRYGLTCPVLPTCICWTVFFFYVLFFLLAFLLHSLVGSISFIS